MAERQPTSVYLYFDAEGILIYVGITSRRSVRQAEHRADKDWWPFVARQAIEHYDSRAEAARREAWLIRVMCPPFNSALNPDRQMRDAYLRFASAPQDGPTTLRRVPLVAATADDSSVILRTLSEHSRQSARLAWSGAFDSSAERRNIRDVQFSRIGSTVLVRVEVPGASDFGSGELMVRHLRTGPEVKRIDLSRRVSLPPVRQGEAQALREVADTTPPDPLRRMTPSPPAPRSSVRSPYSNQEENQ